MAAARVVDADTARTAIAPLRRLLAATLQLGGLLVTVVGGHQPAVLSISDQHVSINGADAVQPHLFGVTAYTRAAVCLIAGPTVPPDCADGA